MRQTTSVFKDEASKVRLFINPDKCRVMITSDWSDRSDMQATLDLKLINDFHYFGSYVSHAH